MTGEWQSLSKSQLIAELATACRQLAAIREELRREQLKNELLTRVGP